MSDIFHEVDEEVRRERLRQLWERYSLLIVAFAVLVVAAIAAWQGYEYWQNKKAAAAGAQFEAAVTLSEQGKHAEAEAAFVKAAAEAPDGYRILARFRAAAETAQSKPADAVKDYDALAGDAALGPLWQDLASVRAGMLLVDSAPLAEMKKRLDPLTEPGGVYRHSARELLALSAWHNNDTAAAKHYLDMIANDAETPPGTRTRADVLSALIAGSGKG
ncbi:MAG TPA: tetratricopeptide repeat protein [Pseudolabrys sp.]|nr:tetratricopeptide repeat protein [Pseudolabrys sp.]